MLKKQKKGTSPVIYFSCCKSQGSLASCMDESCLCASWNRLPALQLKRHDNSLQNCCEICASDDTCFAFCNASPTASLQLSAFNSSSVIAFLARLLYACPMFRIQESLRTQFYSCICIYRYQSRVAMERNFYSSMRQTTWMDRLIFLALHTWFL